MPASLIVRYPARLTPQQEETLDLAAGRLPEDWRVEVHTEDSSPYEGRFSVKVSGQGFASSADFRSSTEPNQLAKFVERARRDHESSV
jgi:hypothetical protein